MKLVAGLVLQLSFLVVVQGYASQSWAQKATPKQAAAKPNVPTEDEVAAATGGILRAMDASAAAWNRGDIPSFMDCYDRSPETTFVGKRVTRGFQPLLDYYLSVYNTPGKMGHLDYSELQVRVLDPETAVATGLFHLTRSPADAAGAGSDSGIFSLVFVKTAVGWKIVLDHTSAN